MPVINVTITLEEHSARLNSLFKDLPVELDKLVEVAFKLWEIKKVCPDEYADELFSLITEELYSSPLLAKQIAAANTLNKDPHLTPAEVADKLHDVAASKVHLAITALEKPLTRILTPFIEDGASLDGVQLIPTLGGICFKIKLVSKKSFVELKSRDTSIYDSWKNRQKINSIKE